MANKSVISITLIIIIGIGLIITTPILSISSGLSNYGNLKESISFKYNPSNSSPIEDLSINSEIGDIEISYISPSVDYCAKLELNIEMIGLGIAGKNSLDYFDIIWQDASPSPSLRLEIKSGIDKDETITLIKNITIFVTLRKDIIFNLNVITGLGNIGLVVPFGVSISNIEGNATIGNILYEFSQCIVNGNITGITDMGNIELIANNVRYTQNNIWNLSNNNGEILFNIIQNKTMGANITGFGETNIGSIKVLYKDNNPDVGALFTFHNIVNYNGVWEGFEDIIETNEDKWWLSRFLFYSDDFPAKNHYNISLYKHILGARYYSYNLLNTNITTT